MPGTYQKHLLPRASAPESRPKRECRVAPSVQPPCLDRGLTACPTAAGTLLPGVCQAGGSHQGDGGGPHSATPGGSGVVLRPGQSPEFVQEPSRRQNRPRTTDFRGKQEPENKTCEIKRPEHLGAPACWHDLCPRAWKIPRNFLDPTPHLGEFPSQWCKTARQ